MTIEEAGSWLVRLENALKNIPQGADVAPWDEIPREKRVRG